MIYHYCAVEINSGMKTIPGTQRDCESVTKYKAGDIVWAGCSFVKILYEL